jgi:hypothetical protein
MSDIISSEGNNKINYWRGQLTSDENIDFLVDIIYQNFKLKSKSLSKCRILCFNFIEKYLQEMKNMEPDDEDTFISEINQRCIDEFTEYMRNKYPNAEIYRTIKQDPDPEPEMVIISEEEKERIVMQYGPKKNNVDNFLELLADNAFLLMMKQIICTNNELVNTKQKYDDILDSKSANELIQVSKNENAIFDLLSMENPDEYINHTNSIIRFEGINIDRVEVAILCDNKIFRIKIPHGFYTSDELIKTVNGTVSSIQFSIEDGRIKIFSTKIFDMVIDEHSVLPKIGFTQKKYQKKDSYIADIKYSDNYL